MIVLGAACEQDHVELELVHGKGLICGQFWHVKLRCVGLKA